MRRISRPAVLAGIAAGGLAAGHAAGYLLLSPDEVARHALLTRTGHGYFGHAAAAALLAALLAAGGAALLGYTRGRKGGGSGPGLRSTAAALAMLQTGGFLALEVVERLASGAGPHDLAGPILAVGLPIQLAVAAALAFLLHGVERAAEAAGRTVSPRPAATRPLRRPSLPERTPRAPMGRRAAPRAPPLLLPSA